MSFGKFSTGKKYIVFSIIIGIVIFGVYSMFTLNTQLSPDTSPPTATVMSVYPGAMALDVATDVSKPMEEAFAKLDGIENISSSSQDNISIIRLTFDYSTDVDQAAIDIQNTISTIRNKLPDGLQDPQVLKFSVSDQPIMTIGLKSDSLSMRDLRKLTEDKLAYELQLVEGVAAVNIFGGYGQEILVSLDEATVRAYGLSMETIVGSLKASNVKAPGGSILYEDRDLLLRVEESLLSIQELENINIPLGDGNSIPLSVLGRVESGTVTREGSYRLNGEDALAILITKKADYNTVDVIKTISEEMVQLEDAYPYVQMTVASDDSEFTNQMVTNMATSVLIAIAFTMIIILLFINNISRSLVISISMPLVFLSTMGLMKLFHMDLDLVTLSALILSIGFVVDTAIVVVENISSHVGKGKEITRAAIEGTDEIALPSIAGATTTLIVLVPLMFITGFVGEMFRPLSATLIFAISSSLVVALIIIPLLTVMFQPLEFKRTEKLVSKLSGPFNKIMDAVQEKYIALFHMTRKGKKRVLTLMVALMALSVLFLRSNGMEMLPKFDSGVSYVTIEMVPGTTLEKTEEAVGNIEDYLLEIEEVISFDSRIGYEEGNIQQGDFGIMGSDQAMITINLTSRKERSLSIWDFQEELRDEIEEIPDVNRYVVKEKGGTAVTGTSAPIAIKVTGEDLDVLYHLADQMVSRIENVPGTTNIFTSFNNDYRQMSLKLDKERLSELGLTSASVSSQLYGRMEGIDATSMTLGRDDSIDVRVGYSGDSSPDLDYLMDTYLTTPLGVRIPLGEVASIEVENRANMVERENMSYTVNINGFTEDRAFSHVVSDIQGEIDKMDLPKGYSIGLGGEQQTLTDSVGDMAFLISLAIVFVYLILVPQFKSFLHPLTIMAAIPMVVIGIAPALGLTGKYMSMPVLLGLILLAGTVVNNSILLVAAINENREAGVQMVISVEEAIRSRFRPIMMTALSDIVGMLPLALQLALGSERFSPLAITVIGGMLAATLLTIIIIPLIYMTLEGAGTKFKKIFGRSKASVEIEPS
ncbi:efflux RND transporter permease subunit [Gudongella sp. SC589]|jgi:multidrug efflux pump subunit AcrB|uniref:efflux RND transporter permease subunit n=1 Tax=Gudongella sp. SC589 TaxID=3385990 RepID=UPI003904AF62